MSDSCSLLLFEICRPEPLRALISFLGRDNAIMESSWSTIQIELLEQETKKEKLANSNRAREPDV